MSSASATSGDGGWPQRCDSLPRSPLAAEQLEAVREACEQKYSGVTVWVGPQPETLSRDLGLVTVTSSKQTIVKFVVETGEHYQVFKYSSQSGGGQWERCAPTVKGVPEAEMWKETLDNGKVGYTPLADILRGGGS